MPIIVTARGNDHLVMLLEEFKYMHTHQLTVSIRDDGRYGCFYCKTILKEADIAHAVWDNPHFPCTSSHGVVLKQAMIFCPRCEGKPNSRGLPIITKGSYFYKRLRFLKPWRIILDPLHMPVIPRAQLPP